MIVRCRDCDTAYRVPDNRIGVRFRCRCCRGVVNTADPQAQLVAAPAGETALEESGAGDGEEFGDLVSHLNAAAAPAAPPEEETESAEFAEMLDTLRGEMADAVRGWDAEMARTAAEETEREGVEGYDGEEAAAAQAPPEPADLEDTAELSRQRQAQVEQEERQALRRYKRWDRRFSERLISEGLLSREQHREALERSKDERVMLFDLLVRDYGISEVALTRCRAEANDIEFIEYDPDADLDPSLFDDIPIAHARRHLFCPYRVGRDRQGRPEVHLVMCDPRDFVALENVELYTGMRARATYMATRADVLALIDRHAEQAGVESEAMGELVAEVSETFEPQEPDVVELRRGITEQDGPIVRLANRIIEEAHRRQASDIHVEAEEDRILVRYRIDGSLESALSVPGHARRALVTRFKIMSGCNITEHRLPQDGRIDFARHGGKYGIDLRVNTLPTVDGDEDVVIRILSDSKPLPLDKIGLLPRVHEPLRRAVERPYGMILCVGPTGSGKTTTLHSLVAHLNRRDRKILTAENPVEIRQKGLRQVQIRPEVGLDFKQALRAFLRQDPDVILVGEMRDLETSSIAVEASLTGHLLLSTLHTNNAPETVTRLTEIGIDPVVLSDALVAVLAQRLMKLLCKRCKRPVDLSDGELREAGLERDADGVLCYGGECFPEAILYESHGCAECQERGFRGRTGVHELLVNSERVKRAVATGATVHELREVAREEGLRELYEDGMLKVLRGLSSVPQLRSVCVG